MRSVIILIFTLFSFAYGHDGGHSEPGTPDAITNGKLTNKDNMTYLDAGPHLQWAGQKLVRKVTTTSEIIYQYSGEVKELNTLSANPDKYLELKVSGGEVLKAFSFDHAGEMHDLIEISSPDFSNEVVISKEKDLSLRWKSDPTASMIKIIIEVYASPGKLSGRVTLSTNDDGEFHVPVNLLSQLPDGEGKIAVKRIWLGQFQPKTEANDMLGVKCAVSVVGKVKVSGH